MSMWNELDVINAQEGGNVGSPPDNERFADASARRANTSAGGHHAPWPIVRTKARIFGRAHRRHGGFRSRRSPVLLWLPCRVLFCTGLRLRPLRTRLRLFALRLRRRALWLCLGRRL